MRENMVAYRAGMPYSQSTANTKVQTFAVSSRGHTMSLKQTNNSRRHFLKTAGVLGGLAAAELAVAQNAHAGEKNLLKVGLIGCGGRGSGAATQALNADKNVKLWAMADAFGDRLDASHARLQR